MCDICSAWVASRPILFRVFNLISLSLHRQGVGQSDMATGLVAGREALMGTKDKGSRSTRKVAATSLKEKRLDKQAKRSATESKANQTVDRAFGR